MWLSRMTKFAGCSVLVAVGTSMLFGQPLVAASEEQQADYFPLRVGSKWHLQIEKNGVVNRETVQITKIETVDGRMRVHFDVVRMGKTTSMEVPWMAPSNKGLFMASDPPVCVLKYPINEGDSWRTKSKLNGVEFLFICTVGKWEQVQVPAGKFKAIKVRVEAEENAVPFTSEYWFTANVGVVMQTHEVSGNKATKTIMRLEKFEKASDKK